MRSTFNTLFYLKRTHTRADGTAPIMCRITVMGTSVTMATHIYVSESSWDAKRHCQAGGSRQAMRTNDHLAAFRYAVDRSYFNLLLMHQPVDAQSIRHDVLGEPSAQINLVEQFELHNDQFAAQVGISKSRSTYIKYVCVRNHLKAFVRSKYHCEDVAMTNVDMEFIRNFETHLRCRGCSPNTIAIYMIPLKHIVCDAFRRGRIRENPFADYKIRIEKRQRSYLTECELKRVLGYRPNDQALVRVCNMFLFSCFTGLSYVDIRNLRYDDLHVSLDNKLWIRTKRHKTRSELNIRLLDIPLCILLNEKKRSGRVFDMPSNKQCNKCLKTIMPLLGIERRITFHTARHTFATTVTLSKGVSIETVSTLLGHRDIKTTQIYAKITDLKIDNDMEMLSKIWNLNAKKTLNIAIKRGIALESVSS